MLSHHGREREGRAQEKQGGRLEKGIHRNKGFENLSSFVSPYSQLP